MTLPPEALLIGAVAALAITIAVIFWFEGD